MEAQMPSPRSVKRSLCPASHPFSDVDTLWTARLSLGIGTEANVFDRNLVDNPGDYVDVI